MKKYIVFLLCIATIAVVFIVRSIMPEGTAETTTLSAVTTQVPEAVVSDSRAVTLGYYEGKSFNPFITDSPTNRRLMTLVYDSLFIIREDYSCDPLIADGYALEDNVLTVTVRSDAVFSDGSAVTPSDVVYSFNTAKGSDSYKGLLDNYTAATAGSESVVFTLIKKNVDCCSCLTFPIVKYGTAQNDVPVGSGRYILMNDDKGFYLKENEGTTRNETMSLSEIGLRPITSEENEIYLLQTGDLSYFFDDLTNNREYMKIGANTATVSLNNMLFVGINREKELMKDKDLVAAVNYAIDREEILQSCYASMGQTVSAPFNPKWHGMAGIDYPVSAKDNILAGEYLEKCGYIYAYENNEYRSKDFVYLEMTLLVNDESPSKLAAARLIRNQLVAVGIDVTLSALPYEEYIAALEKGEYDLYVGEIKLSPDMDLSCFFADGGSAGYGIAGDITCVDAYYDLAAGIIDTGTFLQVFDLDKPFLPILYRDGVVYYSRELTYDDSINEYEPFKNVYSWDTVEADKQEDAVSQEAA